MIKIENNIKVNKDIEKINIKSILYGIIISMAISLIFLLIFSIILVNTSVKENTIKPVVTIITAISILIGSSISTIKIKKNGIINGGMIGIVYVGTLYILSSVAFTGFAITPISIIIMLIAVITGMIGRNNWSKSSLIIYGKKYHVF